MCLYCLGACAVEYDVAGDADRTVASETCSLTRAESSRSESFRREREKIWSARMVKRKKNERKENEGEEEGYMDRCVI